jgi:two-component system OmpR family sensor kinase
LLHALNQPLTGLQCSMEVALARPRTPEQYVQGLREGLELTERMRALVEAIREVTDGEGEESSEPETIDFKILLRDVVDGLEPVAEMNGVRITLEGEAASSEVVRVGPRRVAIVVFRIVESALTLAARGSALRIETGTEAEKVWMRIRWQMGRPRSEFSRPELGLLVAQAGLERGGAKWVREQTETLETVTVQMPGLSAGGGNS